MKNLYQINSAIQQIIEVADEVTGEINQDAFDKLQLDKAEKQLNIIKFIKHLDNDMDVLDKEMERLKLFKKQAEGRKEWLKNYLKTAMDIDGVTELDFTTFKAKVKQNPPSVVIDNEEKIPKKYLITKEVISISKALIKTDLQAGNKIEGCHLEQAERLDIL